MTYTHWNPADQTPEARANVQAWADRKMKSGEMLDPHDPEMLMCLDKGDIVSRYLLLLEQSRTDKRQTAEHHDYEMRRMREAVTLAAQWWKHCLTLRHQKRKTAQLADMPTTDRGTP